MSRQTSIQNIVHNYISSGERPVEGETLEHLLGSLNFKTNIIIDNKGDKQDITILYEDSGEKQMMKFTLIKATDEAGIYS